MPNHLSILPSSVTLATVFFTSVHIHPAIQCMSVTPCYSKQGLYHLQWHVDRAWGSPLYDSDHLSLHFSIIHP